MAEQPVDLASGLVRLDEDAGGSWRLYSGIAQGGKSKRRSFGVEDDDSISGDIGGRSEVDVSHGNMEEVEEEDSERAGRESNNRLPSSEESVDSMPLWAGRPSRR